MLLPLGVALGVRVALRLRVGETVAVGETLAPALVREGEGVSVGEQLGAAAWPAEVQAARHGQGRQAEAAAAPVEGLKVPMGHCVGLSEP